MTAPERKSARSLRTWLSKPPPEDRTTGAELLMAFAVALIVPPVGFALASYRLIRHGRTVRAGWYLVDLVALLGTLVSLPALMLITG